MSIMPDKDYKLIIPGGIVLAVIRAMKKILKGGKNV
jgi:hypothetical protein